MGITSLTGPELRNLDKSERIVQYADDALLLAKKKGRNRIELYRPVLH
jgi:PleD family two-component response regulator